MAYITYLFTFDYMQELIEAQEASGADASPVLPEGKKNIMIDIDGTITDDVPNEQPERMSIVEPYEGAVATINAWYNEGHVITFFTSRSSAEHKDITEDWLNKHEFKYHHLLMDKPRGGNYHWIDNHIVKGTRYKDSWESVKEEMD